MFAILLSIFTIITTAHTMIVCRNDGKDQLTCPDDFYCCHEDKCCKVYFARDDDEDADEESFNSWLESLCLRAAVVCTFMILLVVIAKSVRYFRKKYLGKSEQENLPRYLPLDKNIAVPELNNISVLIGTPLYQITSESLNTFRSSGGVPI